ncbi:MAG TPA: gliding motility-associated C-terminal domain-containing protein [Brumimicrobium sp.]|nr:gliding motility-associated C-terminal domain-containing protein [Brumimicrobium sp.]
MKVILTLVFSLFIFFNTFCQIHYFSDCFKGGVVGDGYNAWYHGGISQVNLPIPPGCTVKKAFFFSNIYKWTDIPAVDKTIEINGFPLALSEQHSIGNSMYMHSLQCHISTVVMDITSYINPATSVYTINPLLDPNISSTEFPFFSDFYILVLYENSSFQTSCIDVYINNQNTAPSVQYAINPTNSIDLSEVVGLSVHSSHICDTIQDGYKVKINGINIGLIGGQEDNTAIGCAGVIGSFYYQNGQLFGIGNDTSDSQMLGTDAIATIQSYLTNQNINVSFDYQGIVSPYSNVINQLFLTYSSPCDTFSVSVPSDTTICYGEQLQLNVTGGQQYEWIASTPSNTPTNPAPGLSCSDCPNPIFTGNSSMVYTVRIWNDDSCSVVRPVRVNVSHPEPVKCYTGETKCGFENGYISINSSSNFSEGYFAVTPDDDTLSNFTNNHLGNLSAGDYKVYYIDAFGCKSKDTLVTIETYNNTIADFSVDPSSGTAPLETTIENQSQNATHFEWFMNGESTGDNPINIFDSSGEYKIGLVAWEGDASCADTTWKTIFVFDSLVVTLPNVFTPNNDGVNDYFNVKTNLAVGYQLSVLNRWGNVVFEQEGELAKGIHNLWDGKTKNSEPVTDGTYFYTISFKLDSENVDCEITDCELRKEGFVQVFGE